MATAKTYRAMVNYRFLANDRELPTVMASETALELDESEVWNMAELDSSLEFRRHHQKQKRTMSPRLANPKRMPSGSTATGEGGAASSLPMNIPDWSKILREEYKGNQRREYELEDDGGSDDEEWSGAGGGGSWVPPHELLARTRIASSSVHEGIGRTLKGRDLSRVRNAVWEKIGFQD